MSCCEEYKTNDDYTYSNDSSVDINLALYAFDHHRIIASNLDQGNHEREVIMISHSHIVRT